MPRATGTAQGTAHEPFLHGAPPGGHDNFDRAMPALGPLNIIKSQQYNINRLNAALGPRRRQGLDAHLPRALRAQH